MVASWMAASCINYNKALMGETECLRIFGPPPHVTRFPPWLLRSVKVSTSSELYPNTRLFLFESLGIQFYNLHLHVTYGTLCHARGHLHSCLGKQKISPGMGIILSICLSSHAQLDWKQFPITLNLYLSMSRLKYFACGEDFNKKHRAAATLISQTNQEQ